MVAICGWIMPAPLAIPRMFTAVFSGLNGCAGQLGAGVGGHDGVCELSHALLRCCARRGQVGQPGCDLFHRQRNANDTGGGGKNLVGAEFEKAGQLAADLPARPYPGLAGGAVGVARVHYHGTNSTAAGRQRCASDYERGGDHSIPGEQRSRRCAGTGFYQREVRASAGLDSSASRRKLEPGGQRHLVE